jgi:hypothetical protein
MLNYTIGAVRRTRKYTPKKKSSAKGIGYTTCSGAGRALKKKRSSKAGAALRTCNPLVQKYGVTAKKWVSAAKKKARARAKK